VDRLDDTDKCSLITAIRGGYYEIVNLRDNYQGTARSWGAVRGWMAVVRLLMNDPRVQVDSRKITGDHSFE